jgi:hypothetical protein
VPAGECGGSLDPALLREVSCVVLEEIRADLRPSQAAALKSPPRVAVVVSVVVPDLVLLGRRPAQDAADDVVRLPLRRLVLRLQPFGIRETFDLVAHVFKPGEDL